MEEFIKKKINTATMQPLPQTWGKIEAVLDEDKKKAGLYRQSFTAIVCVALLGTGVLMWYFNQTIAVPIGDQKMETSGRLIPKYKFLDQVESPNNSIDNHNDLKALKNQYALAQANKKMVKDYNYLQHQSKNSPVNRTSDSSYIKEPYIDDTISETMDIDNNISASYNPLMANLQSELAARIERYDTILLRESAEGQNEVVLNKKRKYYLLTSIGVASTFYLDKKKNNNELDEKSKLGWNAQIMLGCLINSTWDVQFGARYSTYNWATKVGDVLSYDSARASMSASMMEISSDSKGYYAGDAKIYTSNQLNYLSIPIFISYSVQGEKIKAGLGLGLAADWLKHARIIEYYPQADIYARLTDIGTLNKSQSFANINSANSVNTSNVEVLNKFGYSFSLIAPLEYKMTERWSLSAAPYYTKQISSFLQTENTTRNATAYGVQLGVKLAL